MLPLRTGPKLPQEPAFKHPPVWIHEAVAARVFRSLVARRESKRRAILKLIDRLSLRPKKRLDEA